MDIIFCTRSYLRKKVVGIAAFEYDDNNDSILRLALQNHQRMEKRFSFFQYLVVIKLYYGCCSQLVSQLFLLTLMKETTL